MAALNLQELNSRVVTQRKKRSVKNKARYNLARSLGLPSAIAAMACQWSEDRIRDIAKQHKDAVSMKMDENITRKPVQVEEEIFIDDE